MNVRFALTISSAVFFAALLSTASFAQEGPEWQSVTVDNQSYVGQFTSLAFSPSGWPAISYHFDSLRDLKYAWKDASGWHTTTLDSQDYVGYFTSLAFGPDGYPAISYYDETNAALKYAWMDASGWHTGVVDGEGNVGQYTSLAFGPDGYPAISYFDEGGGNLKYAWMDGSGWHTTTVDSQDFARVGLHTSLAFGPDGYPVISYYDDTNYDLKYAWMDDLGWYRITIDSQGNVGVYTSLAFGPDGYPVISYCDWANRDLKYAWRDASGWHTTTVDSQWDVGTYTSLAFGPDGYPAISYFDISFSDLKYAWMDDSGWQTTPVDSGDNAGTHTSLAFGPGGYPAISYHDGDLKYASGSIYSHPLEQPIDYMLNFISFPLVPVADPDEGFDDGAFQPALVFAYEDLINKLFRFNVVTKSWQIYDDDFDYVLVGRGYALYVFGDPLEPSYGGWPAPPGYALSLPRLGFNLVGCAKNEPTPMTELRIQLHTDGEIRTAEEDFDSPDPWLSWDWIYWDSVLDSYAICSFDGGDDDQLRPWFGYWVWQNVDDLWLLWP